MGLGNSGFATWFDKAAAIRCAVVVSFFLLGNAGQVAGYMFLAGWALRSPLDALESLALACLVGALNPGVFPEASFGALRWLVVVSSAATATLRALHSKKRMSRVFPVILVFACVAATASILASYALSISIFKIAMFVIGAWGTVGNMSYLPAHEPNFLRRLNTTCGVFIALGFPLILLPVGYTRNGRGFQGLMSHPQAYAVFLAPLLALLISWIQEQRSRLLAPYGLAAVAAISLVASQARTGVLAVLVGVATASIVAPTRRASGRRSVQISATLLKLTFVLGCLVVLSLHHSTIGDQLAQFAFKYEAGADLAGAFYQSRGAMIEVSVSNFLASPAFGIGFGLPSHPALLDVVRDPYFGLPIRAPAEKGMTVVAVLEETGLVGIAAFTLLVWTLLSIPVRARSRTGTALVYASFASTFGEATFFSFGGIGLFVWLYIAAGLYLSRERQTTKNRRRES